MTVRRFSVRAAGAVAAAGALLAVSAGSASAHECYVANRSAQGNASVAEHSAAWTSYTLSFVVTEFFVQPQEVADCVVARAPDAGVPTMFVVGGKQAVGQEGVIMEHNPNADHATDGHGIDHAEDVYGATIAGLVLGCGGILH